MSFLSLKFDVIDCFRRRCHRQDYLIGSHLLFRGCQEHHGPRLWPVAYIVSHQESCSRTGQSPDRLGFAQHFVRCPTTLGSAADLDCPGCSGPAAVHSHLDCSGLVHSHPGCLDCPDYTGPAAAHSHPGRPGCFDLVHSHPGCSGPADHKRPG